MKKIAHLILTIFILASTFSCVDQDFDVPEIEGIPIGDVLTIEQINQMIQDSVLTPGLSAYTFTEDYSVYGVVTADETSGNIYKSLYFESAGHAINLYMNESSMVRVGDSIRVALKGLSLSQYSKVNQIQGIIPGYHIIKKAIGLNPQPTTVSLSDLLSFNYTSRLVKLENVQFEESDLTKTYADPTGYGQRSITDCSGTSVIVRTSNYANFAETQVAQGNGTMIAIASRFNNTIQLYIRDVTEVLMEGERCGTSGTGDPEGIGTFDVPFNVAAAKTNQGELEKWVEGYLVGVYETKDASGNDLSDYVASFTAPFNTSTNVIIADDPNETNLSNCLVVQLPIGEIRDLTNLAENQGNKGKSVKYLGNLESYFGESGLKSLTGYWMDGDGIIPVEIEAFFEEGFTSNLGSFSGISVVGDQVWTYGSYDNGCAVMSGFVYGSGNFANEDWLMSPAIDLSGKTNTTLIFRHAVNYLDSWDNLKVMVSTDYDGGGDPSTATWTALSGYDNISGSSWTFYDSGEIDLSAYDGSSNFYVAFKYKSTTSGGATWEVGEVILFEK